MSLGFTSLSETPLSSLPVVAAAGAYTLTVSPATVAIVGQSVTLRAARQLAVSPGTVAITGQSVTLRAARQLLVSPATVAITGQSVTLRAARQLVVSPATVALTGQEVTLTYVASGSTYTLTVDPGVVAITGQSVGLTFAPSAPAQLEIDSGWNEWDSRRQRSRAEQRRKAAAEERRARDEWLADLANPVVRFGTRRTVVPAAVTVRAILAVEATLAFAKRPSEEPLAPVVGTKHLSQTYTLTVDARAKRIATAARTYRIFQAVSAYKKAA